MVHTTGGYLTHVTTTAKAIFDLREDDTYWCTADIGWVTGHSYIIYCILANGVTTVMYEGAPNYPDLDRFWDIIEKYRVTVFYTAPTAIRTFIRWGEEHPRKHDLSSLRLLGTVGEPINPEAWMWYHPVIGGTRCPIVDTWWQSDGYFWVMGRIDDVMNVSGHRIGTMEVESALVSHADVAEAAVVGRPDEITGTAIVAFVTPKGNVEGDASLRDVLRKHVTREIGAIARPAEIRFTDALPKTRSGKIMRRLLRDIASRKQSVGDTSTLEDYSVIARLRESEED